MMAIRILFVCADYSCRSQMAEAFCRELGHDVKCASAGSLPADRVQPDSIAVTKEAGIDLASAGPKGFGDPPDLECDYLTGSEKSTLKHRSGNKSAKH